VVPVRRQLKGQVLTECLLVVGVSEQDSLGISALRRSLGFGFDSVVKSGSVIIVFVVFGISVGLVLKVGRLDGVDVSDAKIFGRSRGWSRPLGFPPSGTGVRLTG
jgi:hypothetical protein